MQRFALLLDGGFVTKHLSPRGASPVTSADVLRLCERIEYRPELADHVLLRRYFYDALPASGSIVNPLDGKLTNLGATAVFASQSALLDEVELMRDTSLRRGDIAVRGWRIRAGALRAIAATRRALVADDLVPHIEQKGVDLRIGLDIARLSLRRLVDTIVVVTGDSDMVPAFKFARREGLRVFLDHLGAPVRRELKAHVDRVL